MAEEQSRPNVLWLTVDQMRAQAMSFAGDPNVRMPNLDRLCRDGVYFPNAVSGFPLCCPARGSWITGRYPHHAVRWHEDALDPSIPTVADAFNAAGYHTAWFGKWHLDGPGDKATQPRTGKKHVPRERRGRFQTWVGYENNNSQRDCWVHGHEGEQEVPLYRLPGHCTTALNMYSRTSAQYWSMCSRRLPARSRAVPTVCGRSYSGSSLRKYLKPWSCFSVGFARRAIAMVHIMREVGDGRKARLSLN